ncbi:Pre-mRNA splicing factor PRP21 like protein-domain-containing protein [Gaertneriomyces semiglobifer]|nr:Pre-mRNA splicing factor PRP21 like protein-domain-containing protein [Gaertneriomyces semiglobifer]
MAKNRSSKVAATPAKGIKIKANYVPKAKLPKAKILTQICPRCNQPVPTTEMAEHVRIELLDPKWKEQREKFREKQRDSNLDNSIVAANLKQLARTRPDIFGGDEFSVDQAIKEQKQKEAERAKLIWDGHSASITTVTQKLGQSTNWEEQLAQLRKEAEEQEKQRDSIGPKVPTAKTSDGAVAAMAPPMPSSVASLQAPRHESQPYPYPVQPAPSFHDAAQQPSDNYGMHPADSYAKYGSASYAYPLAPPAATGETAAVLGKRVASSDTLPPGTKRPRPSASEVR